MSTFGSRFQAVGTVSCSKKLIVRVQMRGAKGHGDSPLRFVCSNVNGSMLRLDRVRITGDVGPLSWEESSGLMPCLILVVGMS